MVLEEDFILKKFVLVVYIFVLIALLLFCYDVEKNKINYKESIYTNLISQRKVTIEYIDVYTKQNIAKTEVLYGLYGEHYKINKLQKDIDGYILLNCLDEDFVFDKVNRIVYEYGKVAHLYINYIDECSGNVLDSEIIDGYIGQTLNIVQKDFDDYFYVSGVEEYTIDKEETEITVSYRMIQKMVNKTEDKTKMNNIRVIMNPEYIIINGKSYLVF